MATRKATKGLDVAVLQKMTEPITVRVEKMRANQKMPLFLPGKDPGSPPGCGWSREDVLNLETFIQNAAGGGFYTATATDNDGQSMIWDFGWDPRQVPEKNYDPGGNSMAAMTAAAPPAAPSPVQVPMANTPFGSASNWLQGYLAHSTPIAPAASPAPSTPGGPSWGAGWGAATPVTAPAPTAEQVSLERMRMLEDRLNQAERDKLAQQHAALRDRDRSQHAQEMQAIKDEMRRMAEARRPDEESEQLKQLRAELERERAAREQTAAEQRFQAQLDAAEKRHQEQMAALHKLVESKTSSAESDRMRELEARLEREKEARERDAEQRRRDEQHREQMQALMNQQRPDPVVELMKETNRQQADANREAARVQQAQSDRLAQTMVNPIQLVEMLNKSGGQSEEFVKSIIATFGGVLETYRNATESILQLQGGGQSPAMTMIQDAIGSARDMAAQYLDVQRAKAVSEARAKGQAAQANAAAAAAVAQARQQVWQQPPSSAAPTGELGGAQPAPNGQAGAAQAKPESPAASAEDGENLASVIDFRGRQAPSEEEMFGDAYSQVQRLRIGVAEGQLSPEQAVHAILQGVAVVHQQELVIPVFTLFMDGRIPDFIDALLPDAPQEFRDACAQLIYQQVAQGEGEDEDGGEYDEEDDGEYADG